MYSLCFGIVPFYRHGKGQKVYKDIYRCPGMRHLEIIKGDFILKEKIEVVYEKKITPFGNSAKIDAPKRYRGWRAYVIIVKE